MTEAQSIALDLTRKLPHIKAGTLRFWGDWFGRPYDNIHQIISCGADGDLLKIGFDQDELLSVWSPVDLEASDTSFRIARAKRVRWDWFFYGRSRTASNRYFLEYVNHGDAVSVTTDVDWYAPNLQRDPHSPAVEMS